MKSCRAPAERRSWPTRNRVSALGQANLCYRCPLAATLLP